MSVDAEEFLDYYEEACKEKDRQNIPETGISLDRRTLAHMGEHYSDARVQTLICCVCVEKNLALNSFDRYGNAANLGEIGYRKLSDFSDLMEDLNSEAVFLNNFDFQHFKMKYATHRTGAALNYLATAPELSEENWEWRRIFQLRKRDAVGLCCPEDVKQKC